MDNSIELFRETNNEYVDFIPNDREILQNIRYGPKELDIEYDGRIITIKSIGQWESGWIGCAHASKICAIHILLKINPSNVNIPLIQDFLSHNQNESELIEQLKNNPQIVFDRMMENQIIYPSNPQNQAIPAEIPENISKFQLASIENLLNNGPLIVNFLNFRLKGDLGHTLVLFGSFIDNAKNVWIVGMDPDAQSNQDMGRFCIIKKEFILETWYKGHQIVGVQ